MITPNNIQYIIYRYDSDEMDELKRRTDKTISASFHWPHFTDDTVFKNRNSEKEFDICFYGSYHESVYPFRYRIRKLLESNTHRFRIRFIDKKEKISGEKLSREIEQSWLTVSTSVGNHDRFVNKYQEIIFSGSCILGNIPSRHREDLKDRSVEIHELMSDDAILDKIENALKDKDGLQQNIIEAGRRFRAKYNLTRGEREFCNIINTIWHDA